MRFEKWESDFDVATLLPYIQARYYLPFSFRSDLGRLSQNLVRGASFLQYRECALSLLLP